MASSAPAGGNNGFHKSHSSPQFDAEPAVGDVETPVQLLLHLLLQKSRSPCPVKATLTREELETAAEDLLQHLAYLSQTGQIPQDPPETFQEAVDSSLQTVVSESPVPTGNVSDSFNSVNTFFCFAAVP
jgi:hypothetical protein